MTDTNTTSTPSPDQQKDLQDLAGKVSRKGLRKIAKGLNKTTEGRAESGAKYWTQANVFKAMCGLVLAGQDPDDVIEGFVAKAKERHDSARETAKEEMGGVATLFESVG